MYQQTVETAVAKSRIGGFYKKSVSERIDVLLGMGLLDKPSAQRLRDGDVLLSANIADKMIENVIGVFGLPLAVVPDFVVNGKRYVVPMVVEEPSIVAGISGAAKLFGAGTGIVASSTDALLIGQIQIPNVDDADTVIATLSDRESELLRAANALQPNLEARGGGVRGVEYRRHVNSAGRWDIVVHILVDTVDAMGANIVNTICEGLAPTVESITGTATGLKILSNLADRALVSASVNIALDALHPDHTAAEAMRDAVVQADEFAIADPYRAATHNKGIMNGIDAVAIATGNDWRSIEAGAHAYAARDGKYTALTRWSVDTDGSLHGEICLPVKPGIVGGSLRSNPAAVIGLQLANVESASELAELMAAVGLAQNFAAIKALATDGIQKGHMRLHARSVAASVNTPDRFFDQVVAGLVTGGEVKQWKARELLQELQQSESAGRAVHASGDNVGVGVAAAKVILLGEHAVVYDKHAIALPLPEAVTARTRETDEDVQISIPEWNIEQRIAVGDNAEGDVAEAMALILQRLNVHDRGFHIDVRTTVPVAMGLGSSAALVVAVIRSLNELLRLDVDDQEINNIAFDCEKLAHGTPSGIDNTLAVYGRPILFCKSASPMFTALSPARFPPLVIASSKSRGSTLEQVAGVRKRYEANTQIYTSIFDDIDQLSLAGAAALQQGDYVTLGSVMNVCQGLLNAIQVSTPDLEAMVDIARNSGAIGAKLTGGGGGGAIVALCPGATDEVAGALRSAGYSIVQTISDSDS